MTTLYLVPHGRLVWDAVVRLVDDATAAWADYAGFHVDRLPAQPPPYSHAWAWSDHRWLRIRPTGEGEAIVGELTTIPGARAAPVPVRVVTGQPWRSTPDGVTAPDLPASEFHLLEVGGGVAPVTFVHGGPLPHSLL